MREKFIADRGRESVYAPGIAGNVIQSDFPSPSIATGKRGATVLLLFADIGTLSPAKLMGRVLTYLRSRRARHRAAPSSDQCCTRTVTILAASFPTINRAIS